MAGPQEEVARRGRQADVFVVRQADMYEVRQADTYVESKQKGTLDVASETDLVWTGSENPLAVEQSLLGVAQARTGNPHLCASFPT